MGKAEDDRRVERVLRSIQNANNRKRWAQQSLRGKYGPHPRCVYCDAFADTIDHVLPRSKGGSYLLGNVVPCCETCNNEKADKELALFLWHRPMAAFRFVNLAMHVDVQHRQTAIAMAVRWVKDNRERDVGTQLMTLGIEIHPDIVYALGKQ